MYNVYTHTDDVGAMHIDQHSNLLVTGNYYRDSYFFKHSGRNKGIVLLSYIQIKIYLGML